MHTRFFLINRSQHAMQKCFFQYERFASAMHTASFHIGNIPYAPGTTISFGPGLKNPTGLRYVFDQRMKNPSGLMFVFIRGMKNPVGFRFIFIL